MAAQPGICALGTSEHCYLELRLAPHTDPARLVAAVAGQTESLSTTGGVNVVVGGRPELWPGLANSRPEDSTGMNTAVFDAPEIVAPGGEGSVVLVQVWEHDSAGLAAMSIEAQEAMMGRTKADSVELAEDLMPASAHVARTVITAVNGEELPILRRNTAYGTPSKHGTIFVGFSADRARLQLMLDRMAGAADGVRDELTRVTRPLTGAYYYVPSLEELALYAPIVDPED